MHVLCYLDPEDLQIDRDELRSRVEALVREGVPVPAQPSRQVRHTVVIPAALHERLSSLAAEAKVSVGRAMGAYAAEARRRAAKAEQDSSAPAGLRPEQQKVLGEIGPGLASGRIVLAELGTGVGKSRVLGVSALKLIDDLRAGRRPPPPPEVATGSIAAIKGADRAQEARADTPPGTTVCIAAPTVSNVAHLLREFAALDRPDVRLGVLLGRQQFVSRSRLAALLSDHPSPSVTDWLFGGMAPRSDVGRALFSAQPGLIGLVECLRQVDPAFPAAAAALGADDSVEDAEFFDQHREVASRAEVLFTTHAMACVDALGLSSAGRQSILPPLLALLVDEAHKLEEAQAGVLSSGLHLSVLKAALGKRDLWAGSAAAVDRARAATAQLLDALQDIGDDVQLSGPGASAPAEAASRVRTLAAATMAALKDAATSTRKVDADASVSAVYLEAMRALGQVANPKSSVHVQFSPIRKFPSLIVGPATVSPFLSARWATTPAVLLTSGTLLLPTLQGLSHAAMVQALALPQDRVLRCHPIHPNWLTHTPKVYVPGKQAAALLPPKADDPASLKAWAEEQARQISRLASTAAGGTLVLCSGYERVSAIAVHLQALGDRLIVQDRKNAPLSACESAFRAHGNRPIWIATGGAWTGLDLSDGASAPEDDLLLTDLVVTATPFGMVHTSTHLSRVARSGFVNEKRAALMMLRQGLGRLIRRQGVQHRRLWFLDGRFASPQHASLMSEVKGLMQTFAQRSELPA